MDPSTDTTAIAGLGNGDPTFSKTTDVHDARMGMYEPAYGKTAERIREAAGEGVRRAERRPRPKHGTPEDRYLLRELEKDAALKARDMEEAVERKDKVDLGLAAMELLDDLRELWQKGRFRSDEWRGVLNFLQIALAGEVFEEFDATRCRAVKSVIEKHLTPAATQDDVGECLDLLENAGLDPWKPVKGLREQVS